MQNNQSNNKFTQFWKSKGYYMVLGLCVVAVAVAGYVFVSDAMAEKQALEQTMSTPATVIPPQEDRAASETVEASTQTELETSAEAEAAAPVRGSVEQTVMPVSGTVIQDYAMDRLTYNETTRDWRVHNGVDLAAPLGQEVQAARAGTVTAVFEDDAYGVTVVLQHAGGWSSRYCGLAKEPSVTAGDTVEAGQVLGTVGTTALVETAQEPHLHFEVYCGGEPADPAGFLY